jgi:hypothetical protein
MAIADSEVRQKELPCPSRHRGRLQPARVGSQYPDDVAEQWQIPAEFVAGTDGPAVKSKPGKTTKLHGGFSLQYQGLSPGKAAFILQKALLICREAVY